MASKLVVKQGYVKFWRLGSIEFGKQDRWARAPRSRGLWAFPYPHFDQFFTYHKYMDLVPKHLRDDAENVSYEEQAEWVKKVGRKVLPIREFWYKGDVFTHFTPSGDIGDTGIFEAGSTHWSVMDATKYAGFIRSSGGNKAFFRYNDGPLERVRASIDHMEVFIAPGMGKLADRL